VDVLPLQDQDEKKTPQVFNELSFGNHGGCCAICLDTIPLQETAMVKGCEHAYWYVWSIFVFFRVFCFVASGVYILFYMRNDTGLVISDLFINI
jgi:hypothetical protein